MVLSPSGVNAWGMVISESHGLGSHGSNGLLPPETSTPLVNPSPSQSASNHAWLGVSVWLATTKEQGLFGSVPSITSWPFVTPSPSQSASNHAWLTEPKSWFVTSNEHGSLGSVPSGPAIPSPSGSTSSPFEAPSPSQSASNHAWLTEPRSWFAKSNEHGSLGSVPFGPAIPSPSGSTSSPFVTPSPSQSAVKSVWHDKTVIITIAVSQISGSGFPSSQTW